MAELPGILNWALAGLEALYARDHFIIPPSSLQEIERYRVDSDPVRQFTEAMLTVSNEHLTPSSTIYELYSEWSRDNGYQPLASNSFAARLESVGFTKMKTRDGRFWKATIVGHIVMCANQTSVSALAAQYMV